MTNLKPLQIKYKLALMYEVINDCYTDAIIEALDQPSPQPMTQSPVASGVPSAPAASPAPATQSPAAPAPAAAGDSNLQTPQDLEKAVEADPNQLPDLINAVVDNIKNDPHALAALQKAAATHDVKAIQALVARYAPQANQATSLTEHVNTLVDYVNTLPNREEVLKSFNEFVVRKGDLEVLKEYDVNLEENILGIYNEYCLQEGLGDALKSGLNSAWTGIKNLGASIARAAGPVIGKYGPWAALGALVAGPIGAAALPLITKALERVGRGGNGTQAPGSDYAHHAGDEIKTDADLSNYQAGKTYNTSAEYLRSIGVTDEQIAELRANKVSAITDAHGNLLSIKYDARTNTFSATRKETAPAPATATSTPPVVAAAMPPSAPAASASAPAPAAPASAMPAPGAPVTVATPTQEPHRPLRLKQRGPVPLSFSPKLKRGDKGRFSRLASNPGGARKDESFYNTADSFVKDFHKKSK